MAALNAFVDMTQAKRYHQGAQWCKAVLTDFIPDCDSGKLWNYNKLCLVRVLSSSLHYSSNSCNVQRRRDPATFESEVVARKKETPVRYFAHQITIIEFLLVVCNDLPNEILKEIFEANQEVTETLANRYDEHGEVEISEFITIDEPPPHAYCRHLLLQVCHHWRDIVFKTPRLWTTISFIMSGKESFKNVALYFERSGSLPLNVRLMVNEDPGYDDNEGLYEGFLPILQSHLQRVRVLVLLLEFVEVLPALFPVEQHFNLCCLETFYCESYRTPPPQIPPLATIHAPKIKELDLLLGQLLGSFLPPSFENLGTMSVGFDYPIGNQELQAISQCRQLHYLQLHLRAPLLNSLSFQSSFQHLRSLSLLAMTEQSCLAILRHVHTPMLEQFCMVGGFPYSGPGPVGNIVWICPFLRQNTQLKILELERVWLHADMTDCFTPLVHLTALKMLDCDSTEIFINTFLAEVNGRLILPNLRLFEFRTSLETGQDVPINLTSVARTRLTDDEGTSATVIVSGDFKPWHNWMALEELAEKYPRNCFVFNLFEPSEEEEESF